MFRKILDNQEIRATLDRHWEATVALNIDKAHEIYHDDVIYILYVIATHSNVNC